MRNRDSIFAVRTDSLGGLATNTPEQFCTIKNGISEILARANFLMEHEIPVLHF